MKNALYLILLIAIFLASNLFSIEHFEENESSLNKKREQESNTSEVFSLMKELNVSASITNAVDTSCMGRQAVKINDLDCKVKNNVTENTKLSTRHFPEGRREEYREIGYNGQVHNVKYAGRRTSSLSQIIQKNKEEYAISSVTFVNKDNKESKKSIDINKKVRSEFSHNSGSISKQYDCFNQHLPKTVFTDDYIKQFFFCIKKNNLTCLSGIINKLQDVELSIEEILGFRNKFGDTPLIYAVKQGQIDAVRFLLLQGANPRAVNNSLKSPIDIAIDRKQIKMINTIAEMIPYLLESKKISNEEASPMCNFAMKMKESMHNAKVN